MSKSEKINVYIFTGLPEDKREDFNHQIKEHDPKLIIEAVCELLNVTEDQLKSGTRKREVVEARHIAIALISAANPQVTLKELGAMFNRDHSTIVYARESYQKLIGTDKNFRDKVNLVKTKV